MSKADGMFEELRNEKIIESNIRIDYEKEGQFFDKEICAGECEKTINGYDDEHIPHID